MRKVKEVLRLRFGLGLLQNQIGLALSGGGFRATAFHLGVLKRLRELGLLDRIHVISTVSGGSITGAAWAYWQARAKEDLTPDEIWNAFEYSLLSTMAVGVRSVVFFFGFLLPGLLIGPVGVVTLWLLGQPTALRIGLLVVVVLALAYLCWHYSAPLLLEICYERMLFGDTKTGELNRAGGSRRIPLLMVNATALNGGQHMVFATAPVDMSYAAFRP